MGCFIKTRRRELCDEMNLTTDFTDELIGEKRLPSGLIITHQKYMVLSAKSSALYARSRFDLINKVHRRGARAPLENWGNF